MLELPGIFQREGGSGECEKGPGFRLQLEICKGNHWMHSKIYLRISPRKGGPASKRYRYQRHHHHPLFQHIWSRRRDDPKPPRLPSVYSPPFLPNENPIPHQDCSLLLRHQHQNSIQHQAYSEKREVLRSRRWIHYGWNWACSTRLPLITMPDALGCLRAASLNPVIEGLNEETGILEGGRAYTIDNLHYGVLVDRRS